MTRTNSRLKRNRPKADDDIYTGEPDNLIAKKLVAEMTNDPAPELVAYRLKEICVSLLGAYGRPPHVSSQDDIAALTRWSGEVETLHAIVSACNVEIEQHATELKKG